MKAYVLDDFDAAPRLREVPDPACGADQILVRVVSSSVNPVDRLVMGGFFRDLLPYRFPVVLGRDLHGEVVEVGSQVSGYSPGDRVSGFLKRDYTGDGAFAEYVACAPERFVTTVPDGVSARDAGVLPVAGATALACVDGARVSAQDTVLISGAAGGTGTFAVQLAAATGARVLATCRPGDQARLMLELGAQEAIDWTAGPLAPQVRALAPGGVDVVIELARPRGADAASQEAARTTVFAETVLAMAAAGCRVVSTTNAVDPALLPGVESRNIYSNPVPADLQRVVTAVAEKRVRPVVAAEFTLDDIEAALASLDSSVTGKIALAISDPSGS